MDKLNEAYELVTSARPNSAIALLVDHEGTLHANAVAVLRLASMFKEEDWKFMRQWLNEQVSH